MNPFLIFINLVTICFLFSCSHTKNRINATSISFNENLILPWVVAKADTSTEKSPALYEFKKDQKKLWYLASQHSNQATDPVFRFIDLAVQKKPDVIIVEGFERSLGLSPESISKSVLVNIKNNFYPSGEPSYAIELALKNKILFVGGEPSDLFIYQQIQKNGYTINDLLSFNFIRRMPQINRSQELKSSSIEKEYTEYVKIKARDFGYVGPVFTFSEFKNWYEKNQGQKFSLTAGEKGETAPIAGPFLTQKISLIITKIRDVHILQTISEMMNTYNNVLIIYGSSHYRLEHQALKDTLGPPINL